MKKINLFIAALAATVGLVSCNKNQPVEPINELEQSTGMLFVNLTPVDGDETKAPSTTMSGIESVIRSIQVFVFSAATNASLGLVADQIETSKFVSGSSISSTSGGITQGNPISITTYLGKKKIIALVNAPRQEGIKDLETFIDGAETYLKYSRINRVRLKPFDGNRSVEEAEAAIRKSIDDGLPVPMLMLKHQDPTFDFFEWHWFLIVGYAAPDADAESDLSSPDSGFQIKVATYGKAHWLDFESFWDTGFEERGGLVLVSQREGQRD